MKRGMGLHRLLTAIVACGMMLTVSGVVSAHTAPTDQSPCPNDGEIHVHHFTQPGCPAIPDPVTYICRIICGFGPVQQVRDGLCSIWGDPCQS